MFYRLFFFLFFFLGVSALGWSAAEEVSRDFRTLKQKFLDLERSLPPIGKPSGAVKRAASKVGEQLKGQMASILGDEKIESVGGVNALAQKIFLRRSEELIDFFSLGRCMAAAQDMKRFSINDNVFSYDYIKAGDAHKSLFLQYTRANGEVIDVTVYSFFYTLLHNLDVLKKAMRGASLDPASHEKVFAVKAKIEGNYSSIKASIETLYARASEGLEAALEEVVEKNP